MAVAHDPHAGQPVLQHGPAPSKARLTSILIHGRGDSAEGILGLAHALEPTDVAYLVPEAAGRTWYPYSFLAPIEQNEPYLTSALRRDRPPGSRAWSGRRPARTDCVDGLLAGRMSVARIRGASRPHVRRSRRVERRPYRAPGHASRLHRSVRTIRRYSWGAATWTRTFRWRGSRSPPVCSVEWALTWTSGFTPAWTTRSMRTSSRPSTRFSGAPTPGDVGRSFACTQPCGGQE